MLENKNKINYFKEKKETDVVASSTQDSIEPFYNKLRQLKSVQVPIPPPLPSENNNTNNKNIDEFKSKYQQINSESSRLENKNQADNIKQEKQPNVEDPNEPLYNKFTKLKPVVKPQSPSTPLPTSAENTNNSNIEVFRSKYKPAKSESAAIALESPEVNNRSKTEEIKTSDALVSGDAKNNDVSQRSFSELAQEALEKKKEKQKLSHNKEMAPVANKNLSIIPRSLNAVQINKINDNNNDKWPVNKILDYNNDIKPNKTEEISEIKANDSIKK